MKIYLAARVSRKSELCKYADELRAAGHDVTSRWLGQHDLSPYEDKTPEERQVCGEHDLADVLRSDCVVSFTEDADIPNTSRGGRHVELGIGIAAKKILVIVGPRENVFHWLPGIKIVETWPDCMRLIGR